MATARLRQTFKYTSDSSDSGHSSLEALDETQQDQLIASLKARDSSHTDLYRRIFLAVPIFSTLPYLIFQPGLGSTILSVTSLAASAYIMEWIPIPASQSGWRDVVLPQGREVQYNGPVRRYIVPLNGALATVIAFGGWIGKGTEIHGTFSLSVLPLFVFVIILLARLQLRPIDMDELSNLKYNYKGA